MTEWVDILDSANQKYDNTTSGLAAGNAQDAIDELAGGGAGGVQAFVQLTEPVSPSLGDFWIEAAPE